MTQAPSADAFLLESGLKSAKFKDLGDIVQGTILDDPEAKQCVDFDEAGKPTGQLAFWPSGDPMWEVQCTIQTDQREDADDDGRRRLHVTPRLRDAVAEAVKAAGAPGLRKGGVIAVQWCAGTGQGKGNPRQYRARYTAPAPAADALWSDQPAATQPVQQVATPAPVAQVQPTPTPAVADPWATSPAPAQQSATMASVSGQTEVPPLGIDQSAWAAMPEAQRAQVRAAAANPANQALPF